MQYNMHLECSDQFFVTIDVTTHGLTMNKIHRDTCNIIIISILQQDHIIHHAYAFYIYSVTTLHRRSFVSELELHSFLLGF